MLQSAVISSDLARIDQSTGSRQFIVRTSERALFKRCRRKWGFESGNRMNLRAKESPSYFWLGTGGHFAMEDFHGYNYYQHPVEAFRAYCVASETAANNKKLVLPPDYADLKVLMEGILSNYLDWLSTRNPLPTYWHNDAPQVELKCLIPLPVTPPEGYDEVLYSFQVDRVVDYEGNLYIQDWKFYKQFGSGLLEFDQQLSAYIWAAHGLYPRPITGAILHEFRKDVPNDARILKNGEISTAKNQKTTYYIYRQALIHKYGSVNASSLDHQDCLNALLKEEQEHGNQFIRRGFTYRTEEQIRNEGEMILHELEDILNPNLPLYTNATRDCSWDCQLKEVCLLMNRGDDWQSALEMSTQSNKDTSDAFRLYLPK